MSDVSPIPGSNTAQLDEYRRAFASLGLEPHVINMMQPGAVGVPTAAAAPSVDQMAQRTTRFGLGTSPTDNGAAVTTPLSERARGQRVRVNTGTGSTVINDAEEQKRYMALDNADSIKENGSGRSVTFSQLRQNVYAQVDAQEPAAASPGDAAARTRRVEARTDEALERDYGIHRVVGANDANTDRYAIRRVNPATGESRLAPESRQALTDFQTASANPTARSAAAPGTPGAANPLDFALRNAGGGMAGMTGLLGASSIGMGSLSMSSVALNAANGLAFQMRKQMRSTASNFGDYGMIAMINSPGISIESLIYYFMAYMSDKYEDKLREKMEEVVIQEQRERNMQQRRDAGELLGGIAGLMVGGGLGGIMGASGGSSIGAALGRTAADTLNSVEGALSGSSKSTTVLMQEVQILIQNWKMIMDMTSNVSKTLHEMAMTAVRNLR